MEFFLFFWSKNNSTSYEPSCSDYANIYTYFFDQTVVILQPFGVYDVPDTYIRYTFSSNHNIHENFCDLCFLASDTLIDRF